MRYKVLSIAGLDPSGGAGILADVKTFSALGCYGMTVITALTAQNTKGVSGIFNIATNDIISQFESVVVDIMPDAIKIGMLFNEENICALAVALQKHILPKKIPIVLDPVMMAKSGDALLQPSAVKALRDVLIPLTDIITPNLREAEVLLKEKIGDEKITHDTMAQWAKELLSLGSKAVLLKGGHLTGTSADDYYIGIGKGMGKADGLWLHGHRVATKNTHGTGCTLSSAIASGLAKGMDMATACQNAKKYLHGALLAVEKKSVGGGAGPLHHFYTMW